MRIQNNLMAMNTQRNLTLSSTAGSKSMGKLSSGYRINSAADDAAGLSISEKMRGQIRGLGQASRNAQDGISMIQTAEGALGETQSILQRMREITVEAANDTNSTIDRQAVGQELKALTAEIDRISQTTTFNGKTLIDGKMGATVSQDATSTAKVGVALATTGSAMISAVDVSGADAAKTYTFAAGSATNKVVLSDGTSSQEITIADMTASEQTLTFSDFGISLKVTGTKLAVNTAAELVGRTIITSALAAGVEDAEFAIGANGNAAEKMTVKFEKMDSSTLGSGIVGSATKLTSLLAGTADVVIDSAAKADALTKSIEDAIQQVSNQRGKLGAAQNRLEHTIKNLDNTAENLQAAESRVRDVDMAREMMEYTKNNILQQAATSMLAQANQAPQAVLQLLK